MKKNLLPVGLFFYLGICMPPVQAAHIIGGEITYKRLGYTNGDPASASQRYLFTMKIYRDCLSPGSNFDSSPGSTVTASVTIFAADKPGKPLTFYMTAPKVTKINPDPGNKCVETPQNVCVEEGVYTFETDLPIIDTSYIISYQRCCRNNTITNIRNPERSGATYTVELTSTAQKLGNNSATFRFFPPIALCTGTPFVVDHSGIDAEGDSLSYSLCGSLVGGGEDNTIRGNPYGIAPDPDLPPPYELVQYVTPTFSALEPLGSSAGFRIDAKSGIMQGTPMLSGQFVVGVCMDEYRNGQLLTRVLRDFQFNITPCTPNVVANPGTDSVNTSGQFLLKSCGDTAFKFSNKSTKKDYIQSQLWEFDTPSGKISSTDWEATLSFPGPGYYFGILLLNPNTLCTDTAHINLQILPPVSTTFSIETDTCQHQPLAFVQQTNTGGRPISTYSWNFGDGSGTSRQANPSYAYTKTGNYTIRLDVQTEDGCMGTTQKTLSYFPLPSAARIQAPGILNGCTPWPVSFSVGPLGDFKSTYTLRWDLGDGSTASGEAISHIYQQPGTFPVSLQLRASGGCQTTLALPQPILVSEGISAAFTYQPDMPDSQHSLVQFRDASTNAQTWRWTFGNLGSSAEQHPSFQFPPYGTYPVTLIAATANGCSDTTEQRILIKSNLQTYWPTIFSPDGDGINDTFGPKGNFPGVQSFRLHIFSRWGDLVYESADFSEGWNGRFKNIGQQMPDGVYFYQATLDDAAGNPVPYQGTVTLIR